MWFHSKHACFFSRIIVSVENTCILYTIYYIFSNFITSDRNMFCPLALMCFLHLTGLPNDQGVPVFSGVHVFQCPAVLHCDLDQKHIFGALHSL
jgi:hypothetical protein